MLMKMMNMVLISLPEGVESTGGDSGSVSPSVLRCRQPADSLFLFLCLHRCSLYMVLMSIFLNFELYCKILPHICMVYHVISMFYDVLEDFLNNPLPRF